MVEWMVVPMVALMVLKWAENRTVQLGKSTVV